MPAPQLANIQFANENQLRSYPFVDWATKKDQTGTITIPDSFLIGMYLPVSSALAIRPERFYLQHLGIFPAGYTLTVGYYDETTNPAVATVSIAKLTHREFRSYAMSGLGDFADSTGHVVIGSLDEIDQIAPGLYTFDYAATALEVDAIWPQIRGVSSIRVVSGNYSSERIYGDIALIAGDNVRLSVSQMGSVTQIRIDAVGSLDLNAQCICSPASASPPIRTINGIGPDAEGNYRILPDKCIQLSAVEHGLQLSDLCSAPCCGCDELQAVLEQVKRIEDGAKTLQSFVSNLESAVAQMTSTLAGTRLSGVSCLEG